MEYVNLIYVAEDTDQWQALLSMVLNEHSGSIKYWDLLEWLRNCWLLKKN
jgi:hypothetical protein